MFLLLISFVLLYLSPYKFIYPALYYNFANIDDYKIFSNRTLQVSNSPKPWVVKTFQYKLSNELTLCLDTLNTTAFQMYSYDTLIYNYKKEGSDSISNSFSMAKSIVAAAYGRALKLGYLKSLDQTVGETMPEWNHLPIARISIRHLLTMSSGIKWDESYASPWSQTTQLYYGTDIQSMIEKLELEKTPGTFFKYKSIDTQLLTFLLKRITKRSVSEFVSNELWKPIGAEHLALWSLDHENGIEKGYCCVNARVSDFARIGYLYMNQGNWYGKQLIDSIFIKQCITPNKIKDGNNRVCNYYGYQWWIIPNYKGYKAFYMRGILGQYVICIPELKMMAVRLGEKRGVKSSCEIHYPETYLIIDEMIRLLK